MLNLQWAYWDVTLSSVKEGLHCAAGQGGEGPPREG